MDQSIFLFRVLFLTACGVGGSYIAQVRDREPWVGGFIGLALGLFVILIDRIMKGVSLRAFSSATLGLTLGLVLATLVKTSRLFSYATDDTQWIIHLSIYIIFGYLGTMLALRSNRDEFSLLIPYIRFIRREPREEVTILDTSSIIDGRIGDLCKSGFLFGSIIIPRFVLDELQALADHPDESKRIRGRHGLDLLNELKGNPSIDVKIHQAIRSTESVDSHLIQLAQVLSGRIATTDYNLSRIAELQNVQVLNINLLANALRPPLIAGERLRLKLIREGKESHQAVGFLPDGTMIVVNNARDSIGHEVDVVVSSAIQTAAGRMIFADLSRNSNTPKINTR